MKRRELLKRGLAIVLAATLTLGSTMTVIAEENQEIKLDNHVEGWDLEKEYVDSNKEEYNNKETSGDEVAEAMTAKAAEAKEAAEEAQKEVEKLAKEVQEIASAAASATAAATAAKEAVMEADAYVNGSKAPTPIKGAVEIKDEAEAKETAAAAEASAYNNQFDIDQKKVNDDAEALANNDKINNVGKEVNAAKDNAVKAADEAKVLLEEALKGDSKDAEVEMANGTTKTVVEIVEDVKTKANEAKEAAEKAQQIKDDAQAELDAAIHEYNVYAMTYNLPLYGKTEVDYDLTKDATFADNKITEAEKAAIKAQKKNADDFAADKSKVLEAEIASKTFSVATATTAVENAESAANAAKDAYDVAKALVTNEAGTAVDKAEEAKNYEVETINAALKATLEDPEGDYQKALGEAGAADKAMKDAESNMNSANAAATNAEGSYNDVNKVQSSVIKDKTAEKKALEGEKAEAEAKAKEQADIITSYTTKSREEVLGNKKNDTKINKANKAYTDAEKRLNEGKDELTKAKKDKDREKANSKIAEATADMEAAKEIIDAYNAAVAAKAKADDTVTAKDNNIKTVTAEIDAAQNKINAAQKAWDDAKNAAEDAKSAYDNAVADKEAKYQAAENIKNNLEAEANAKVETVEGLRDEAVARITNAATEDAKKVIVAELERTLKNQSTTVNQAEYDKALNAAANSIFATLFNDKSTWEVFKEVFNGELNKQANDLKDIRIHIDGMDGDMSISDFFNKYGVTQWGVNTDVADKMFADIVEKTRKAMVPYEKELAIINSQLVIEDMNKITGENGILAEQNAAISGALSTIADAKASVDKAEKDIAKAKEAYKTAADDLEAIKKEAASLKLSDNFTLKALEEKIRAAQKKVDSTKNALKEAEKARDTAKSYADWATALVADHVVRTYAQSGTKNGTDYFTENERNFDLTDDQVKSQGVENFSEVTPIINGTKGVDVPYTIYRDYVKAMYNKVWYSDLSESGKADGKGAATGSGMSVIYWETVKDENGKITLTGKYFTDESELATGTYFVGYSFKHHKSDGYHLDGLMFDYVAPAPVAPVNPAPSEEPSESPSPSALPVAENIAGFEGDVVVIEDSPVALAAALTPGITPAALAAAPAADMGPAVLGARRVDAANGSVLGARKALDQAVLGKRRAPQTGDDSVIIWMLALLASLAGAAASVLTLKKQK